MASAFDSGTGPGAAEGGFRMSDIRVRNKLKYRKAWRFPEPVEDFIASHCNGFTVHIMNGGSPLGDLRVDKYSRDTDITADAFCLPLRGQIADTVVCDPPWLMDNKYKLLLLREIVRILKLGGILIFNSTWSPKCPGLPVETIYVPERQLMTFQHISLIFIARKVKQKFI